MTLQKVGGRLLIKTFFFIAFFLEEKKMPYFCFCPHPLHPTKEKKAPPVSLLLYLVLHTRKRKIKQKKCMIRKQRHVVSLKRPLK